MKKARMITLVGPSGVGKDPITRYMLGQYYEEVHDPDSKRRYFKDKHDGSTLFIAEVFKQKTLRHGKSNSDERVIDDLADCGLPEPRIEFDCRGTRQIIDLGEIEYALDKYSTVFMQTYYTAIPALEDHLSDAYDFRKVFMSPIDIHEAKELPKTMLAEYLSKYLMFNSLLERAKQVDGKAFNGPLVEELRIRAEDSLNEMAFAHKCNSVLVNHCYESDIRHKFPMVVGEIHWVGKSLYREVKGLYPETSYTGELFGFLSDLRSEREISSGYVKITGNGKNQKHSRKSP